MAKPSNADTLLRDQIGKFDEVIIVGINKAGGLHVACVTNDSKSAKEMMREAKKVLSIK